MQDWRAVLGKNVRRLRQQRGLTQEELAFEAEIDLTYMGGIERGRRNPSLLVITRIAKALSVAPATTDRMTWGSAFAYNLTPLMLGTRSVLEPTPILQLRFQLGRERIRNAWDKPAASRNPTSDTVRPSSSRPDPRPHGERP
jgi:transcriptional regulator with XRE-family HTH domain